MTISFNEMPSDIRVPGAYVEVDNSRASGNLQQPTKILVIGQRLSTGTVAAETLTRVTTAKQGTLENGVGSAMANMLDMLFRNNEYTEKWYVSLADNGSDKAAGTLAITGPATESGTLHFYFGGQHVTVSVADGDTATEIGDAIDDAIAARPDLPITSVNTTGTVAVTYKNAGTIGNDYDMRVNYRGKLGGEVLPAGVGVVVTNLSGGSGDPDVTDALAVVANEDFDFILTHFTDDTNLDALDDEMVVRWNPLHMKEGHVFTAFKGTAPDVATFGESRNGQHMSVMDAGYNSPTPPMLWAAAMCGLVAYHATIDPARPFNGLPMVGVLAEPNADRRTLTELNTLLYAGIATHNVNRVGAVSLQRIATCYQVNSVDVPDASYLDANTLFTVAYFRKTLRARITSRFPRHKLADNGTKFGAGQAIVTPKIIKAEIVALAQEWEQLGLLEDIDQFKNDLIVERNLVDRNRVDAMLPSNLVNQFHIFAAQISFII